MAYNLGAGGAFGGYPGGYNQFPGGANGLGFGLPGAPLTLGSNLPSVNPNNYGGTVHFGPAVQYSGQVPPGAGFPNQGFGFPNQGFGAGGAGGFYPGI